MKLFIFQLRVSNSKVDKQKLKLRVSNSKGNLMLYEVELVTRKKNFCNFELVTGNVASFCVIQFRNSRIPKLIIGLSNEKWVSIQILANRLKMLFPAKIWKKLNTLRYFFSDIKFHSFHPRNNRSSHRRILWKKVLLEISQNLQENTCARVFFLTKLQASACNFVGKETLAQLFSKNTFFTEYLWTTAF